MGKPKVLYIEDNIDIRDNVFEILELAGFEVFTADDGKTGIALAIEKNPNIILCDILLPQVNGFEVFHALKERTDTSRIPFIFLTASADKKDVEKGIKIGANGYIKKPFDPDDLINNIKLHINQYSNSNRRKTL